MPFDNASSRASAASSAAIASESSRRAARSIAACRFPQTRAFLIATATGVPDAAASTHECERVDVLAQLPQQQLNAFALGFECRDDPQRARRVACEPRLRELEDVVAGDVGDRALDRFGFEIALRQKQAELFDFLARRKQVPLAALGKEGEGLAPDALSLQREARGDPRRQLVARRADRRRSTTPAPRKRGKPSRCLRRAIEPAAA